MLVSSMSACIGGLPSPSFRTVLLFSSAILIVCLVLHFVNIGKDKTAKLLAIVSIPLFGLFVCFAGLELFVTSTFSHRKSIHFGDHTYQLAISTKVDDGWDYTVIYYILYQCDNSGLFCDREFVEWDSTGGELVMRRTDFAIDPNENALYIQLDGETVYTVQADEATSPQGDGA